MKTRTSFLGFLKSLGSRTIAGYIGILLVGLLAFNFGGSSNQTATCVLGGLLFAVSAFLALEGPKEEKSEKKTLLIFLLPVAIFLLFSIVSLFWISMGIGNVVLNLIGALSIFGAFFFAMQLKRDPKMPKHILLYSILFGLALLSLSNFIASLCEYGFFYLVRFKGMSYFLDGVSMSVTEEMAILDGFTVSYVSPYFGFLPSFLLSSSLLSLLFVRFKEDRFLFLSILCSGSIGLLTIVLLGFYWALLPFVPLLVLALLFRFIKGKEKTPLWETILFLVLLVLVFVVVFVLLFVAGKGTNIYASNKYLRKIFDNGKFLRGINETINVVFADGLLSQRALFGMPVYDVHGFGDLSSSSMLTSSAWGGDYVYWTSFNLHTFEFSVLMENGLVGFLAFLVFTVSLFPLLRRSIVKMEEGKGSRVFFASYIVAFYLYQTLFMDALPFLGTSNYVSPIMMNSFFMVLMAALGEAYTPSPFWSRVVSKKGGSAHA